MQQIQKLLENSPLIILGSGSSADYGLPLMGELSDKLKKHSAEFNATEFALLTANLATMNLEKAIDKATLSEKDDADVGIKAAIEALRKQSK